SLVASEPSPTTPSSDSGIVFWILRKAASTVSRPYIGSRLRVTRKRGEKHSRSTNGNSSISARLANTVEDTPCSLNTRWRKPEGTATGSAQRNRGTAAHDQLRRNSAASPPR